MEEERLGDGPEPKRAGARLTGAQRREHLLDAAAEIIVSHGLETLTMEGVAAHAGVSKGLGYAYFANREDLIVALFDREMAELDRRVAAAVTAGTTFEERVRATLWAMFDMVVDRGVLLGRLLQRPPSGDTPLAHHQKRRAAFVERHFGELAAAEFDLDPEVARAAATVLLVAASASIDLWVRQRMKRKEVVELVVRLVMGGLRAVGAEPLLKDVDPPMPDPPPARARPGE